MACSELGVGTAFHWLTQLLMTVLPSGRRQACCRLSNLYAGASVLGEKDHTVSPRRVTSRTPTLSVMRTLPLSSGAALHSPFAGNDQSSLPLESYSTTLLR